MPALRNGRASRACTTCRRGKTRCYTDANGTKSCLRCHTLALSCSFNKDDGFISSTLIDNKVVENETNEPKGDRNHDVASRLASLETMVLSLTTRLDTILANQGQTMGPTKDSQHTPPSSVASLCPPPAPVILIRDASIDSGIYSQEKLDIKDSEESQDVISSGLVPFESAHELITLFIRNYGRWILVSQETNIESAMTAFRRSPLLLTSVLLIAIRHTEGQREQQAEKLLREVKKLLGLQLLIVPQNLEFYQAIIILSLWSTSAGRVPMKIDSWVLTSHALQQTLVTSEFAFLHGLDDQSYSGTSTNRYKYRCIWNHLVLAHLQICVSTQRKTMLTERHISLCKVPSDVKPSNNYEMRMVAEVQLYWINYQHCCSRTLSNIHQIDRHLELWQRDWKKLFDEPRSQFLQLGFKFTYLFAHYQWLQSSQMKSQPTTLIDMIALATDIITVIVDTTDGLSQYLTDHVYHIVTFAALVLCHILPSYQTQLQENNVDTGAVEELIIKLLGWLETIGTAGHIARVLWPVISYRFAKMQSMHMSASNSRSTTSHSTIDFDILGLEMFTEYDGISLWSDLPVDQNGFTWNI
ncbi:hypothetical protein VHEMI09892 [[Torrubiella] hemipterigena]|uniref:Transcriptional activator of proteases prtT n=1 Tax=[Torrubiella] hemipterigena TaxID=1531966 RepID=A0A0A1THE9_9HYPO|nr:hypothetical protein VHEMI09892 [[Torrubiella] hemipterigena]